MRLFFEYPPNTIIFPFIEQAAWSWRHGGAQSGVIRAQVSVRVFRTCTSFNSECGTHPPNTTMHWPIATAECNCLACGVLPSIAGRDHSRVFKSNICTCASRRLSFDPPKINILLPNIEAVWHHRSLGTAPVVSPRVQLIVFVSKINNSFEYLCPLPPNSIICEPHTQVLWELRALGHVPDAAGWIHAIVSVVW